MSQHTPGPWHADDRESGAVVVRAQDDFKRPVAEIWHNGHDPKANGALVAAAPDLLEALRLYVILGSGKCTIGKPQVEMARAAIAKAEGR